MSVCVCGGGGGGAWILSPESTQHPAVIWLVYKMDHLQEQNKIWNKNDC